MQALSDKRNMVVSPHFLKPVRDWVLPERCLCRGVITAAGGPFCADCWQKLHFLNPPWGSGCASPFAFDRGGGALCASGLGSSPNKHDGIRAAVKYDEVSSQVALRMKHAGKIGLAKMIAHQLVRHLPDSRSDINVTPVPLHWIRMWSRSFHQSALIAKELSRLGKLEYILDLIVRQRQTPSIHGLSKKVPGKAGGKAFAVHPRWEGKFQGRKIILVDDVLTTGATSDGCIGAIKKGRASWIQLFCWARALKGEAAGVDDMIMLDA